MGEGNDAAVTELPVAPEPEGSVEDDNEVTCTRVALAVFSRDEAELVRAGTLYPLERPRAEDQPRSPAPPPWQEAMGYKSELLRGALRQCVRLKEFALRWWGPARAAAFVPVAPRRQLTLCPGFNGLMSFAFCFTAVAVLSSLSITMGGCSAFPDSPLVTPLF